MSDMLYQIKENRFIVMIQTVTDIKYIAYIF